MNFINRITYYLKIWLKMSKNSFQIVLSQKIIFVIFLTGKILRFFFFITFLYFILQGAEKLAGYNTLQAIFFYLTFVLIDTTTQFFFREVYRFRSLVVSGDLDLVLLKPINTLFRVLMGGADVIDLITIPPILMAVLYVGHLLDPTPLGIAVFIILVLNGLLIATAFHIAVVSLGIITLEIDHTIMIYRDITSLARFPIDIYAQPLRGIFTYLIPIGIMITFPAKAIMGLFTPTGVVLSVFFGVATLFLSVRLWNKAIRAYTSASN